MLDPEAISQYFVPTTTGDSVEISKTISENAERLEISEIRARTSQAKEPWYTSPSFGIDGTPGIPFERGIPNPNVFSQGEDIVFDLLLVHDGKKVTSEDFQINVIVKTNPRAVGVIYAAELDKGIDPWPNTPGYFELWIPSSVTSGMLPGTYILAVQIAERVGQGAGKYDRKHIALQHYFNIEYSNFSTTVENSSNIMRGNVEHTWPNGPSTVVNA
jgi:hypothetical protein